MSSQSVTFWIQQTKLGRQSAMVRLWHRYYDVILRLIRPAVPANVRRVADEEDVAALAFQTFFRRAQAGEFPDLNDRDELWNLLLTITQRKASNQVRDWTRLKRGGGQVLEQVALVSDVEQATQQAVQCNRLTPDEAAMLADTLRWLLGSLSAEERQVAELRMSGHTIAEIAQVQNRSTPTIVRRLRVVRKAWEQLLNQQV